MKRLILAVVLIFFAASTTAEPSGALKAMLDTRISLLEYHELMVDIRSLNRRVKGDTTRWKANSRWYESIVEFNLFYDGENKLYFAFYPDDQSKFKTAEQAKQYCRGLLEAELSAAFLSVNAMKTPDRWWTSNAGGGDFKSAIFENTVLQLHFLGHQFEDSEAGYTCRANLNKDGEIAKFSFKNVGYRH